MVLITLTADTLVRVCINKGVSLHSPSRDLMHMSRKSLTPVAINPQRKTNLFYGLNRSKVTVITFYLRNTSVPRSRQAHSSCPVSALPCSASLICPTAPQYLITRERERERERERGRKREKERASERARERERERQRARERE